MATRRLMEIKLADSVGPDVQHVVDKWNEALSATLDYMDQHTPDSVSPMDHDIIMNLPMNAYLSFVTPMIYAGNETRRLKKLYMKKLDARLAYELAEYSNKLENSRLR